MLQSAKLSRKSALSGAAVAVVASLYNDRYVGSMLKGAKRILQKAGVKPRVVRVPGAYEIPLVTAVLARSGNFDAVICLGVILRGETSHADLIGESITQGLSQLQLETEVPIIHEVLLLGTEEQARKRCIDPKFNRGIEAAESALAMIGVMRAVNGKAES